MRLLRLNAEDVLTKEDAARIILRTQLDTLPERIHEKVVQGLLGLSIERFIREFNRCTNLELRNFGNGKFQIR